MRASARLAQSPEKNPGPWPRTNAPPRHTPTTHSTTEYTPRLATACHILHSRQPEIEDLNISNLADCNVARLEIAMDDARAVQVEERPQDLQPPHTTTHRPPSLDATSSQYSMLDTFAMQNGAGLFNPPGTQRIWRGRVKSRGACRRSGDRCHRVP
jgi:hypothetical protein